MDKTVWLLGGSIQQYPMAMEIKRRGYKLLLTDSDPDCVCRPLADTFYPVSIYSAFDNLKLAKELTTRPAAVLTVGTDAGVEVSTIADYFDLPAAPVKVAKRVRSKIKMRYTLDSDYPTFKIVEDVNGLVRWERFPCVVKPGDASGSNGVRLITEAGELSPAVKYAYFHNRQGETRVLIERYLPGVNVLPLDEYDSSEVALDFFVENGTAYYANGALRLFSLDKPGIEVGHFNPFVPDDNILKQVQQAAEKLGVTWGPFKVDFKLTPYTWHYGGWVLMECATRLSGGFDHSYTCPAATGKDITGAMLDMALGKPLDRNKLTAWKDLIACCLAPFYGPGKVQSWNIPAGANVYILAEDEIKSLESNSQRPVFVIEVGTSQFEALERAKVTAQLVRPYYV